MKQSNFTLLSPNDRNQKCFFCRRPYAKYLKTVSLDNGEEKHFVCCNRCVLLADFELSATNRSNKNI